MITTDPIADLLSRIRNAVLVQKSEVTAPYSSIKLRISTQLKTAGYLDDVKTEGDGTARLLRIVINQPGENSRINSIERVSKPGRRIYTKADEMPIVKSGRGLILVSTSKGIMSGKEANKQALGGEVICRVY